MPGKEAKIFFRDEKGAPKNFCRAATKTRNTCPIKGHKEHGER
jgi:hypothetical protein